MLVWIAAALSGGAALAYEICWSRSLVVPLGNAMDAAAMVLAGFMLGIGAGARLGGSLAERTRSPLRLYAAVEMALAAYAAFAPTLLGATSGIGTPVFRYLAALVLIGVPGLCMGASLPLLARALTAGRAPLSRHISILYGANTAGAALGATVTGFWGIAALGVSRCSLVAAALSASAAVIALAASWRAPVPRRSLQPAPPRGHRRLALVAVFASGMGMLLAETLWARVLTFVFGHDTYAFASLLTIVLVGLALGGTAHRALAALDQRRVLGWLLATFALGSLSSFWLAAEVVSRDGRDPFDLTSSGRIATSVWLELYRELAFTPLLVLVPAMAAGAVFPAACCLYAGHADDSGRSVGVVTLVNGVGSALGALLAPMGIVAAIGLESAFAAVALGSGAVASVVLLLGPRDDKTAIVPFALAWGLAMTLPSGLPQSMLLRAHGERHWELRFYAEGRTGTVSVIDNTITRERQLLMNGINEVTTRLVHDQSFKVLGQLAPLLHPDPKRGVMICLGAGLSAGSALAHPLERLDVVDLSETVAGGARWFAEQNNRVLDDPRLHLHVADGRRFLLDSHERYDVAIVDSTHPKSVDSWILYTREFYELLRSRLSPDGIAVQWLPLHGLSEQEFQIIVRTFAAAFPDMTLWANAGYETHGQVAYAKLVGPAGGAIEVDRARVAHRLAEEGPHADLARYGVSSVDELLDAYLCDAAGVEAWTSDLPLQTDDHPLVPYTTKWSGGRPMTPALLLAARQPVGDRAPFSLLSDRERAELEQARDAQGMVLAGLLDRAAEVRPAGHKIRLYLERRRTSEPYYRAVAETYADDVDRSFEAGALLGQLGYAEAANEVLSRVLALRPRSFRARLNLALLASARGDHQSAIGELTALRSEEPRSAIVLHNLGAAVLAAGDPAVAAVHFREALAYDPSSVAARLGLARAQLAAGADDDASNVLTALVAEQPHVGRAYELLARLGLRRGDAAEAVAQAERAVAKRPYDAETLYVLGLAHYLHDQPDDAERAYLRVLHVAPDHPAALDGLGLLHAGAGRFDRAADLHLRALDADPMSAEAALHLGLALVGQGRPQQALGAICLALRLDPGLTPARQQLVELGRPCDTL